MALQLTEQAAQEVKTILDQQGLSPESTFLRLGVRGGGCSGFSYSLDLTDQRPSRMRSSRHTASRWCAIRKAPVP